VNYEQALALVLSLLSPNERAHAVVYTLPEPVSDGVALAAGPQRVVPATRLCWLCRSRAIGQLGASGAVFVGRRANRQSRLYRGALSAVRTQKREPLARRLQRRGPP
jgi:hypothetical protein